MELTDRALAPEPPGVFLTFLAGMLGAAVLSGPGSPGGFTLPAGGVLVAFGVGLHTAAWRVFRRRGTPLDTLATPTELVTSGPFARTRNPMYLGGVAILAGWALLLGRPWLAPAALLFGALAERWWIRPEEGRLARELGEEWDRYRSRVRRWV